jgi:hypothetical protein
MNESRVAETVWPWRSAGRATTGPTRPRLRTVLFEVAVMLTVAALFRFWAGKFWAPLAIVVLAAVMLIGASVHPPLYAGIKRAFRRLGVWLGVACAWILLAPFFYVVFSIGRLGLMLSRKDPLDRAFEAGRSGYWMRRPPPAGPERYRRQF